MIPPSFDYCAPTSVKEAVGLLQKHGPDAMIFAVGMSLIPLMKLRLTSPGCLVDINRIPGLDYIKEEGGFLRIGALARESDLEKSELVRAKYPILVDTYKGEMCHSSSVRLKRRPSRRLLNLLSYFRLTATALGGNGVWLLN